MRIDVESLLSSWRERNDVWLYLDVMREVVREPGPDRDRVIAAAALGCDTARAACGGSEVTRGDHRARVASSMRSLPPLEVLAVAHYAFRRIEDLGPTEAPSDLVPRAAQLAESALRSEGRTEVPPIAQLRNHLEERQSRLDERAPPLQSPLDWSTYHRLSASVALLDCVMSVAEVAGMDATAAGEHAIAYEAARVLTSVAMSMERYYDELDWQVELLWAVLLEPVLLARH